MDKQQELVDTLVSKVSSLGHRVAGLEHELRQARSALKRHKSRNRTLRTTLHVKEKQYETMLATLTGKAKSELPGKGGIVDYSKVFGGDSSGEVYLPPLPGPGALMSSKEGLAREVERLREELRKSNALGTSYLRDIGYLKGRVSCISADRERISKESDALKARADALEEDRDHALGELRRKEKFLDDAVAEVENDMKTSLEVVNAHFPEPETDVPGEQFKRLEGTPVRVGGAPLRVNPDRVVTPIKVSYVVDSPDHFSIAFAEWQPRRLSDQARELAAIIFVVPYEQVPGGQNEYYGWAIRVPSNKLAKLGYDLGVWARKLPEVPDEIVVNHGRDGYLSLKIVMPATAPFEFKSKD